MSSPLQQLARQRTIALRNSQKTEDLYSFHQLLITSCSCHLLRSPLSRDCEDPLCQGALSAVQSPLKMRRAAPVIARQLTRACNAVWHEVLPDRLHASASFSGPLAHQEAAPMFRVLRTSAAWPAEQPAQLRQQREAPPEALHPAAAVPVRGFSAEAAASNLAPCERPPVEQEGNDLDGVLEAAVGQGPAAVLALVEAHGERFTEQNVVTALRAVAQASAAAPSSSMEDVVRSEWYQALVDMLLAG